jgi:hypothetical protein
VFRGHAPPRKMVCLFRDQWVRLRDLCQAYRLPREDWDRGTDRNAGALRCLGYCRRGRLFRCDLVAGWARRYRRGGGCGHGRCRLFLGPRRRCREGSRDKRKGLPYRPHTQTPQPISCNDAAKLLPMANHVDLDNRIRFPVEAVWVSTQGRYARAGIRTSFTASRKRSSSSLTCM